MAKYVDSAGLSRIGQKADARFLKQGSVAPAFSTSQAYTVGDYVMYNNVLYRFTSAKSAGAWDASKVEVATLAADVAATSVMNLLYVDDEGYLCTRVEYSA